MFTIPNITISWVGFQPSPVMVALWQPGCPTIRSSNEPKKSVGTLLVVTRNEAPGEVK